MSVDAFFTQLESEQDNFCKWTGELYLELHNGSYTSQVPHFSSQYWNQEVWIANDTCYCPYSQQSQI